MPASHKALIIRQIKAIIILPLSAAIIIPAIIIVLGKGIHWNDHLYRPFACYACIPGMILTALGLVLIVSTILLFHFEGKGTLAPWDRPTRLVVKGPYRWVRNPMISGVLSIILGESVLSGSISIFLWFIVFLIGNMLWIPFVEEPGLARHFGDAYLLYKKQVPRWIPRIKPWTPDGKKR